MTWLQVLLEWLRHRARTESRDVVMTGAEEHAGARSLGIEYAVVMLGEHASEAKAA